MIRDMFWIFVCLVLPFNVEAQVDVKDKTTVFVIDEKLKVNDPVAELGEEEYEVDFSILDNITHKKTPEEKQKRRAIEEERTAERVKWITHDYENGIPKARPKKIDALQKAIKLDDIRYMTHSIIMSFLDAAFSDSIWNEDASTAGNAIITLKRKS